VAEPTPPSVPSQEGRVVSVQRFVPAAPQAIFDLLADPRQHPLIDGSGSVKAAAVSAPERLSLGATFSMSMKIGAPYKITNEVVEFEEGRQIGWRHVGGHIWRYVLEPTEGGTVVTEQFDWSTAKAPWMLRLMRATGRNERSMEATLDRMVSHFSTPTP
jgi:hypothetical protein